MRFACLLIVAACGSSAPITSPPPAVQCGTSTCAPSEICVPGGDLRNGIGATVHAPPSHCAPLPASCGGVASCACVSSLCPVGGCASIDGGRLVCLAG